MKGGWPNSGPNPQLDTYFAGFPLNELTPQETILRKALIDFLGAPADRRVFPLTAWIERRIGGEIEVFANDFGGHDIRYVGTGKTVQPPPGHLPPHPHARPPPAVATPPPPPPGRHQVVPPPPFPGGGPSRWQEPPELNDNTKNRVQTWISKLPDGHFGPQENLLREATMSFFAGWGLKSLPSLTEISNNHDVKSACSGFLPKDIPFKEWLEYRIGAEVELHWDYSVRDYVVKVTDAAMPYVREKKQGQIGNRQGQEWGQPRQGRDRVDHAADAGKWSGGHDIAADTFFAQLPQDKLLDTEADLRQAVLDFLGRWPHKNASPSMEDCYNDQSIQRCSHALFRNIVKSQGTLREWIENRIGGEVDVQEDLRDPSIWLIGRTGEIKHRPNVGPPTLPPPEPAKGKGKGSSKSGKCDKGGKSASAVDKKKAAEEWLKTLPDDKLLDDEVDLRQSVLNYIENHCADGPIVLANLEKDEQIDRIRALLIPAELSLRAWLEERIGGEVRIWKEDGRYHVALENDTTSQGNNAKEEKEADEWKKGIEWKNEEEDQEISESAVKFIEKLPENELTPEEEELREAVLNYVDNWKSDVSSTVSEASSDPEVRRCKDALLPHDVSLRYWIEERIGGEVETKQSSEGHSGRNETYIGHIGRLALPVKKRRPEGGKKGEGKNNDKKSGKSRTSASTEAPWKKFRPS